MLLKFLPRSGNKYFLLVRKISEKICAFVRINVGNACLFVQINVSL